MHSAEHPEAAVQLLTRACSDAIEKDYLQVRLDAPPVHPLHPLIVQSSGKFANHEADQGLAFMTNLLNPRRFFQLMGPAMAKRVHQADLTQPCQLGLLLNQEKHQLSVDRDGVELKPGALGRSYLKCSSYEFHQLLLGHLALEPALESGRVSVSTRVAGEIAAALFPPLPLWRPPWDEMAAE